MRSRLHPHSWKSKFGYAFRGLRRAFRTQHSFAIHLLIACVVVAAAALAVAVAVVAATVADAVAVVDVCGSWR